MGRERDRPPGCFLGPAVGDAQGAPGEILSFPEDWRKLQPVRVKICRK